MLLVGTNPIEEQLTEGLIETSPVAQARVLIDALTNSGNKIALLQITAQLDLCASLKKGCVLPSFAKMPHGGHRPHIQLEAPAGLFTFAEELNALYQSLTGVDVFSGELQKELQEAKKELESIKSYEIYLCIDPFCNLAGVDRYSAPHLSDDLLQDYCSQHDLVHADPLLVAIAMGWGLVSHYLHVKKHNVLPPAHISSLASEAHYASRGFRVYREMPRKDRSFLQQVALERPQYGGSSINQNTNHIGQFALMRKYE